MSGGVWVASYVVLWGAVVVLLVVVLALVRQIGVLHARLDGAGAGGAGSAGSSSEREPLAAAEGPPLGSRAPMPGRVGYERSPLTLVAFTSASCELSQVLAPALRVVDKQYDDVRVLELPLGPRTIAAFEAFNVLHTPFVVAVGRDGRVRGRGRARNLQQLEMFVERALAVAAKAAGRSPGGEPVVDITTPAAAPSSPAGAVAEAAPSAETAEQSTPPAQAGPGTEQAGSSEPSSTPAAEPPAEPAEPSSVAAEPVIETEPARAPAPAPDPAEADAARAGV